MSKSCLSCAVSFLKASHFSRPWSPWPGNTWGSCLRSRLLASDFVITSLSSSLSSSSAKYAHARRVSQFLGSSLLYCPFFSFFRTHHLWSDYGIYYVALTWVHGCTTHVESPRYPILVNLGRERVACSARRILSLSPSTVPAANPKHVASDRFLLSLSPSTIRAKVNRSIAIPRLLTRRPLNNCDFSALNQSQLVKTLFYVNFSQV